MAATLPTESEVAQHQHQQEGRKGRKQWSVHGEYHYQYPNTHYTPHTTGYSQPLCTAEPEHNDWGSKGPTSLQGTPGVGGLVGGLGVKSPSYPGEGGEGQNPYKVKAVFTGCNTLNTFKLKLQDYMGNSVWL